jgi:hypothetical protein
MMEPEDEQLLQAALDAIADARKQCGHSYEFGPSSYAHHGLTSVMKADRALQALASRIRQNKASRAA